SGSSPAMLKPPDHGITMQVAGLRADYLTRLPGEIAEMQKLVSQLQDSAETEPVLEALQERLHRLTGTGGTLGFTSLSGVSREIELQIRHCLQDGHCPGSATLTEIITGINRLDLFVTEGEFQRKVF